jgi:hypothetical protein
LFGYDLSAQTSLEAPSSFPDPVLLATIFSPSPPKPTVTLDEPIGKELPSLNRLRNDISAPSYKPAIPEDWEAFDKQFAPDRVDGQPHFQFLENGMYKVNQTLYSMKLFERQVNSLLNFEYSLHEISGYDARTKANQFDNFFDHAKLKTDFDWDAPVGIYVGLRFQIKCYSIFQFWK